MFHGNLLNNQQSASNVLRMLVTGLLQLLQPTVHAASDGTLWRTPKAAFFHDLLERKWAECLPTLKDGNVVRRTRKELRLSQTDLARQSGISRPMLALIEGGRRRMTDAVVQRIWVAFWHANEERKNVPAAMDMLVRLEGDLAIVTRQERL